MSKTEKDSEVSVFLADLCKVLGTLDGVSAKWPDGRLFKHRDGKWQVVPKTEFGNA